MVNVLAALKTSTETDGTSPPHSYPLQTIAQDLRTVTVYFHPIGAQRFIDFVTNAFGGKELMRHAEGDMIMHAKVQVGDSVIELGEARHPSQPLPTAIISM
jgi:hypothetical protein